MAFSKKHKSWFRFVSLSVLSLAAVIMLLHAVLPHQHHNELSATEHSKEHQSPENLLDWLELVFHYDQGEQHLEDYATSEANYDSLVQIHFESEEAPSALFFALTAPVYPIEPNGITHTSFSPENPFRGPPVA